MKKENYWKLISTKHLSDTKKFSMIVRKICIFYEGVFVCLFVCLVQFNTMNNWPS